MSAYSPNQDELTREQRLLNDPRWQSERDPLRDLLARVERAANDDDFFAVHVSHVARLRARQDLITDLRTQRELLVERRRGLAKLEPKPVAELVSLQGELEQIDWDIAVQRQLYWLLLDVGDALVWRRLSFDRAAIAALGQGRRVAWLSDGVGWDAEVAAVNQLSNDGVLALLNDATTCLRLGDITCFFEDRVEIREVKAGKVADADHPQQVRLQEAITLINERRPVVDGDRRAIVRCPAPLESYLSELPAVLSRARHDGRAVTSLSSAQLIVAHDFAHGTPHEFDEASARAAARWPDSDIVLDFGTSLRRMRDRHYSFPYLAPLALLPLRTEEKVDLLLGQLDYTVWLNVSSVARILRGRGFVATPFGPPESARWFLQAGRVRGRTMSTVHIAAHVREQMVIELVKPTYIAKLADTLLRSLTRHRI